MKTLFTVFFVLSVAFYAMSPSSVDAAQQCVACSSSDCYKSNPSTRSCNRKCFTMLLREDSWDEKPFIIKGCTSDMVFTRRSCDNKCYEEKKTFGCTSDMVFTRRSCDNKCYEEKKTFGSIEHYMCVHCCTGDKCNSANSAGFHMRSGIILTFASTTLALIKYLYF